MPKIARITMFKLTEDADMQELIQKYSTLPQDAKKVIPTSSLSIPSFTALPPLHPRDRLPPTPTK